MKLRRTKKTVPFFGPPCIFMRKSGGKRPILPEILDQTDHVGAKSPIFDLFSPVAPQQ